MAARRASTSGESEYTTTGITLVCCAAFAPTMLKMWRKATDELSDLLGTDHDLAVFRQTLSGDLDRFGRESDRQVLIGLIDRRRAELQATA